MNDSNFKIRRIRLFVGFLLFAFCSLTINAQSTSGDYPTAVSTNEISGQIPARDVGDSRLTSFYYTFNGSQGDIFINAAATNFNGDIDVYIADGLRPVTKIPFYADSSLSETGRVLYLRKPEKLILRIQGRTPDDNPAIFKIKFAGSFVAAAKGGQGEELKLPEIKPNETGGVRVNSVGTIIEPLPKIETEVKETAAESLTKERVEDDNQKKSAVVETAEAAKTEDANVAETVKENVEGKPAAAKKNVKKNTARVSRNKTKTTASAKTKTVDKAKTVKPPVKIAAPPNPLENIRLVVLMKDGEKIEYAMSDVFRFTMNNGVLLVITKDGKSHRRSLLDVQKLTVE